MLSRPAGNASGKRKADAIRRVGIAGGPPFIGKEGADDFAGLFMEGAFRSFGASMSSSTMRRHI
jgi:hypothetical protein